MDGDQRMYFDTSVKGSLEDLLDDPLIRLLMDSDEVSVQALITLIEPVQLALSSRTREGGVLQPGRRRHAYRRAERAQLRQPA